MTKTTFDLAREGNADAIATLIEERTKTETSAEIKHSVLFIKTSLERPSKRVKLIEILQIIETLDTISCNISLVHIIGKNFKRNLALRNGKYKDETDYIWFAFAVPPILLGALIYGLNAPRVAPPSNYALSPGAITSQDAISTQTANSAGRKFLGRSKSGYELWADNSCVYVKGIRQSDFSRLNVTLDEYKKVVKQETGFSCVLFE